MYYAIFPDGRITCAKYEHGERGVELKNDADEFLAFVPYGSLHAIVDEDGFDSDEAPPFVA